MIRILIAVCAFLGAFIACWTWMPSTHSSPFAMGSFNPTWAMIVGFIVFCLALRAAKK